MRLIASAALAAILAACTQQTETKTVESPAVPRTAAPAQVTPAPPPVADANTITSEGWGPLRVGMTRAEVTAAVGGTATPGATAAEPGACDLYHPAKAPEGMYVMLQNDRLSSVTVRKSAALKTDKGFGVGDTAQAIKAALGPSAQVMPHKYVQGAEYITAWTKNGPATATGWTDDPAARGVRYETDASGKVIAVHAGGSSIQAVEGCS